MALVHDLWFLVSLAVVIKDKIKVLGPRIGFETLIDPLRSQ